MAHGTVKNDRKTKIGAFSLEGTELRRASPLPSRQSRYLNSRSAARDRAADLFMVVRPVV